MYKIVHVILLSLALNVFIIYELADNIYLPKDMGIIEDIIYLAPQKDLVKEVSMVIIKLDNGERRNFIISHKDYDRFKVDDNIIIMKNFLNKEYLKK